MNFSRHDVSLDKQTCLGIARIYAPMKSGNLKYNAIGSFDTSDGFAIEYSLAKAFYTYFQEEGTIYTIKNRGFIGILTVNAIANYFAVKYVDENENKVADFMAASEFANIDPLKVPVARLNKEYLTEEHYNMLRKDRIERLRAKKEMFDLRERAAYQSKLADMETYSHMSNQYNWQSTLSNEVPDRFKERK